MTGRAPSGFVKPVALLGWIALLAALITGGVVGTAFLESSRDIRELLTENGRLQTAIERLTTEDQIAYAVVEGQETDEAGRLLTTLRFVQTARDDPRTVVSEQIVTVPGDVVHFDAIIVKFTDAYVSDGKERALYLWRRIYSEAMPPKEGFSIEPANRPPPRYQEITDELRTNEARLFWDAVWSLVDHPNKLEDYGVRAIFGNAIYLQMEPGRMVVFKITAGGQIVPEAIREP